VTDETAPGSNVTINRSVGTPNGTLGDLPTVSPDSESSSGTPSPDDNDGTSVNDPDTGDSPAVSDPDAEFDDRDSKSKPKTDIDCGFATWAAQAGLACVGDQTAANDDSRVEG